MRPRDARRWIEIYTRLIEFNEELHQRTLLANGHDGPGRPEADEPVVVSEKIRLLGRLAFWQRRHAEVAPVDLDDRLGIISPDGDAIPLTRREAQLLRFLLAQPGRFFDTRVLATQAWHDPSLASEQVRTYVVRLRRRLLEARVNCDIRSERRRGYALIFDEDHDQAALG